MRQGHGVTVLGEWM